MKLAQIAEVHPGYLNRGPIQPQENGSHSLIQARDVDGHELAFQRKNVVRINPNLSPRDCLLHDADILFMSRGLKNYSVLMKDISGDTLAAASFFIIRVVAPELRPEYLTWYLNHPNTQRYFTQFSGQNVHMPVVRRSVLEDLEVPLPSLAKQQRISELFCLTLKERKLMKQLTKKRKKLTATICMKVATSETEERI